MISYKSVTNIREIKQQIEKKTMLQLSPEWVRCLPWGWLWDCRCGWGWEPVLWGCTDDAWGGFLDTGCCLWGCGDCCLDGDELENEALLLEFGVVLLAACTPTLGASKLPIRSTSGLCNTGVSVSIKRKKIQDKDFNTCTCIVIPVRQGI